MLELRNVCKTYLSNSNKIKVKALKEIDLSLPERGLIVISGKSGSGKTTLLNILGGIDKPTAGEVKFQNETIDYSSNKYLDIYRGYSVGIVFQDFNLLYDYNVIDNVKLSLELQGKSQQETYQAATSALIAVGLEDFSARKINTLSGGQQQRVSIARALAKDSKIVLCDEPTGNLDSKTSREIFTLLKDLSKERLFIVVTHDESMALEFGDRVLILSDGEIIKDSEKELNIKLSCEESHEPLKSKKVHGLSIKNSLLMMANNIKKSVFTNVAVMLILIGTFSLVTVFSSLYSYNAQNAFINTLKTSEHYVMPIVKYVDKPIETTDESGNKTIEHGPQYYFESANPNDKINIYSEINSATEIYSTYFFNKNFQDFVDMEIYTEYTEFQFVPFGFREAIEVNDFSKFYTPLKYGNYPKEDNEVLIYDYMAFGLLKQGVFLGDMQSLTGKILTDKHTGLTLKISGILKSNYENYSDSSSSEDQYFKETYLSSLQVIFCGTKLIEQIKLESSYVSVNKVYFVCEEEEKIISTDVKKTHYTDINKLHILAAQDNYENERGVIVSAQAVANVLNLKGKEEVTAEIAEDFINTQTIHGIYTYYDFSFERNYISTFNYNIIAVCEETVEETGVIALYTPHAEDLYMNNGNFRQLAIGLTNNWEINSDIINHFWLDDLSDDFYDKNPNYCDEGYTEYVSYGFLIKEADFYLNDVKDFAGKIAIFLIVVTAVCVLVYTFYNIKKYDYKIGVLKAIGAKTFNIILIFGLQLLILSLVAFALSIPISFLIMHSVNLTFVKDINKSLIFFAINGESILISLAFASVGVLLLAVIPLLKLAMSSPVNIIKGGKEKL